ncbi:Flp family type IVb pilin [Vibrio rumoiensis]|uniref:Flp family type IVb pilin n=1 Tax=Vibrio rumoiensis TaxID=76258 RepID=UPI0037486660
MNKLMQLTKDFLNDEEGLTIVEYVLGAAALALAVGALFTPFFAADGPLATKLGSILS